MTLQPKDIISEGTQVATLVEKSAAGREVVQGSVGVVAESPADADHSYLVRFPDGRDARYKRGELTIRKREADDDIERLVPCVELEEHIIYKCIMGSRAYGLAHEGSDDDVRGIYVAPAEMHWSLYKVPEQIEKNDDEADLVFWEIEKYVRLALKANPNILETMWTPLVVLKTPVAEELLGMREDFLSKFAYKTFGGYVMSQFKKMEADIRNKGDYRAKHAMHLIRLLHEGIDLLRTGRLVLEVPDERKDFLLSIREGEMPFREVNKVRLRLLGEMEEAYRDTVLPDRPDYEKANDFLIQVRRAKAEGSRI